MLKVRAAKDAHFYTSHLNLHSPNLSHVHGLRSRKTLTY